jgi:hypothetical protein
LDPVELATLAIHLQPPVAGPCAHVAALTPALSQRERE